MIHIGLGEYAITDNIDETLITHALGTCVAIVMYCSKSKKAGMAHVVLPERDSDHHKNYQKEAYFAEDIVPLMIKEFRNTDCKLSQLKVALVGGAEAKSDADVFKVGEKNVKKLKELLKAQGIRFNSEETLGRYSRTVKISVKTGMMDIKKQKMLL